MGHKKLHFKAKFALLVSSCIDVCPQIVVIQQRNNSLTFTCLRSYSERHKNSSSCWTWFGKAEIEKQVLMPSLSFFLSFFCVNWLKRRVHIWTAALQSPGAACSCAHFVWLVCCLPITAELRGQATSGAEAVAQVMLLVSGRTGN